MNRSIIGWVAAFLLIWLAPNAALAHTGLSTSQPENNGTVKEALREITMTFNTDIEPASRFEVVDEAGTSYPVADIKVNRSLMTGTMEEPLPNGVYTVNWRIIGQDGHAVKGAFSFQVDVAPPPEQPSAVPTEAEAPPASPSAPDSPPPSESADPGLPSPDASSEAPSSPTEPAASTGASSLTVSAAGSWVFLGLAAVVLASFIVIAIVRRKS